MPWRSFSFQQYNYRASYKPHTTTQPWASYPQCQHHSAATRASDALFNAPGHEATDAQMLTFELRLEPGDGDLPLGLLRTTWSARQISSATYWSLIANNDLGSYEASNDHDRGAKTCTVLLRVSSGRGTWREHAHAYALRTCARRGGGHGHVTYARTRFSWRFSMEISV